MGYLHELHGIRRRFRSWGKSWAPHLERTRQVILQGVRRCSQRRKAVIFGSGWLLDVPLRELAAEFREIVLVDVVHPWKTRRTVQKWPNVRLLAADVTATGEQVWRASQAPTLALPTSNPGLFKNDTELDFVASVNLLSQLPCVPESFLKRVGWDKPEIVAAYSQQVVRAHLDFLGRLPGVTTLISDVETKTVDESGKVRRKSSTLYGERIVHDGERWIWPLVPCGKYYRNQGKHLEVVGIVNIKDPIRLRQPGKTTSGFLNRLEIPDATGERHG
jgi:hypothetical protein